MQFGLPSVEILQGAQPSDSMAVAAAGGNGSRGHASN